jgi:hypothetical protein
MTVINSIALGTQVEGSKVQTTRNIHCNLFHETDKQQIFFPRETLHFSQIYSVHRHRMGCKEHDWEYKLMKIAKCDANKVLFCKVTNMAAGSKPATYDGN